MTWFRYVPHTRIADYQAAGWRFVCALGVWSCLMAWDSQTDPVEPHNADS